MESCPLSCENGVEINICIHYNYKRTPPPPPPPQFSESSAQYFIVSAVLYRWGPSTVTLGTQYCIVGGPVLYFRRCKYRPPPPPTHTRTVSIPQPLTFTVQPIIRLFESILMHARTKSSIKHMNFLYLKNALNTLDSEYCFCVDLSIDPPPPPPPPPPKNCLNHSNII